MKPPHPPAPGVAIVTGASSGIGRATATLLSSRGWRLALAARDPAKLDHAARTLDTDRTLALPTDVADFEQLDRLVTRTIDRFGRIDALVNNAGHAPAATIDAITGGGLEFIFRVNVIGPAHLIARAWHFFTAQGGGCIVNISSIATRDPFPGLFAYAASKAGLNIMARSCAKEGAPHAIRAFTIAPGAVETPMLRAIVDEQHLPTDECLKPREVAELVLECIEGRRDARNGATIDIVHS